MPQLQILTPAFCKSIAEPGHYSDGGGLALQVSKTLTKSWVFRFKPPGSKKRREMGLGSYPTVTLAQARLKAEGARRMRAEGTDPLHVKRTERDAARVEALQRATLAEAAEAFIKLKEVDWTKALAKTWRANFKNHITPVIGSLQVASVQTLDVKRMLDINWTAKHKTAQASRGYLENVLDWAKTAGMRTGDNPARWEGHIEHLMTAADRDSAHRPALDWRAMPVFFEKVHATPGNLARLMEFVVLTGVRAMEGSEAVWSEIDLEAKVWRIPAERMKTNKEHHVPLSDGAIRALEAATGERSPEALVFPSKLAKAHWASDLAGLLRKLGYEKGTVTTHGMRSSLRTFLSEHQKADSDVAEAVLAHDKRNAVQQAYERTRHFEARVPLMQAWATYLNEQHGQVLALAA